jgi:alkaline phosphatase
MSSFSRRDFLKTGALGSLAVGTLGVACANPGSSSPTAWKGSARNVIFMVSDGMSAGTLSMADHMKRIQFGTPSNWIALYETNRAKRSLMDMASLTSIVTDSAAAAASWGCGFRVENGSLNMGPNGEEYVPVLTKFKNAGKKTGLVTTTRMTHATPSGFIANVTNRGMEHEIAVQMLEREADVYMGGGLRFFASDKRRDNRDLISEFKAKGYAYVANKSELSAVPEASRVLGLFHDDHLPYVVDHENIPEQKENVPTLAEMTQKALDLLSGSNGFLLQVEGGKVDHAAHSNDAVGLVYDQIGFDDAIGVVLKFVESNPDTLLIITSDHGNANPALNGDGPGYANADPFFETLSKATRTNNSILDMLSENDSPARIREMVQTYTTHPITLQEAGYLKQAMQGTYTNLYKLMNSRHAVLGQILANYTAVNFTGSNHTSDLVELASMGPGSEAVNGFVKNTDLHSLMLEAAGISV